MKHHFLAMALGNFAIGTGLLVIAGILRPIAADLGISLGEAGLVVTVYAFAYAISSPLLAGLTSATSRKLLLLLGLGLFSLGHVIGFLAPSLTILFVGRMIAALGAALYTPAASAVAAALSQPHERGQAIGLVYGGLSIATVFGVPIGTFIGLNYGWRTSLAFVAVLSILAGLAVVFTVPSQIATSRVNLAAWLAALKQPVLLLALLVMVFQLAAQFVTYAFITPIMEQTLGLNATGITLMLAVFGVASVIGNLLGGYGADRFGPHQTIVLALSLLAVMFMLFALFKSLWPVTLMTLALWGVSGFGFNPPQQTRLIILAPTAPNAALSLNASALYVGQALGAFVGGQLVERTGFDYLAYVSCAFVLVALAINQWAFVRAQHVRQLA